MKYLKHIAYAAFFLLAFLFFLYQSFPWDMAKDRVLHTLSRQTRTQLEAKSMRLSWLTGVDVERLKITPPGKPTITLDEVHARALLLPLLSGGRGLSLDIPIARGQVDATVIQDADGLQIDGEAKQLELALIPALKEQTGVPLSGKISLKVDLKAAKKPSASQGSLRIKADGVEILKGGRLAVPPLTIGSFDWEIPIKDGRAELKGLKLRGEHAEVDLAGDIQLRDPLIRSILNLSVSFKPTTALIKKEPILNALLSNLRSAKGSDGFYTYAITGSIKHPRAFKRRR